MTAKPILLPPTTSEGEIARLQRRLKRETSARQEAEAIAERGLRDLFQRQQEMALLESIAVAANEATSVEAAMRHALASVCHYAGWPLGHLLLVRQADPAPLFESTTVWHDTSNGRYVELRAFSETYDLGADIGIRSAMLAAGAPVWCDAASSDAASFPRLPLIMQSGLVSMFAFPVLLGSAVVAVLEFFTLEVRQPDEAMLRVMGQVGTQLGRVVERERAQARLMHEAMHDPLTQLGNRKLFLDRLEYLLQGSRRTPGRQFCVLFVDLDRFKAVNDGLGHQFGDQLIVAAAGRLSSCLRQTDLIARVGASLDADYVLARMGGDEFTILLDNIANAQVPVRVAERLLKELGRPYLIDQHEVVVTASIGIALSATGYSDVQHIVRDADIAMYHAKQGGRARWILFDQAMQQSALRRLQMETDLRGALAAQQLFLQYQPIVAPLDGRVRGFETLLRWRHPLYGLVSPAEFIPMAEETGLIGGIGGWVLEQACHQLGVWQRSTCTSLSMSVNLSALQLSNPKLVSQVDSVLRASAVQPGSLKLELTESTVMADPDHARLVFGQLRALGVGLSLDDFGTGYSSLSQLRRLPIDTLKIDRSFVSRIDQFDDKRQIAEAVVLLARALGLAVVAEGAETAAEVHVLCELGCDYVQGYYFSRPLDAAAATALLAARPASSSALPARGVVDCAENRSDLVRRASKRT